MPGMRKLQAAALAALLGFAAGAWAAPAAKACKNLKSSHDYLACLRELARVGEKAVGMTPGGQHKKIGAVQVWVNSNGKGASAGGTITCTKHGAVTTCTTAR